MNKNKLLQKICVFYIVILVLLNLLAIPAYARSNTRLPSNYLLALTYSLGGNVQEGLPFSCDYNLTLRTAGTRRYVYNSVDCGGKNSVVTINLSGKRVRATIPVDVVITTTDGFITIPNRREIDLNCTGTLGSGKFISGTCRGATTEFGLLYTFNGNFRMSPR